MIQKILNKKVSWKIINIFLSDPSIELSFSDLVKITSSSPTNVKKVIDEFNENRLFISKKIGNKILYKLDLSNYLVRSLYLVYSWDKINKFPKNVSKALKIFIEKIMEKEICSVYLFGSSVYKDNPNDYDLAVIYNKMNQDLENIWLELIKDFEVNIEVHFNSNKEFIKYYKEGNYKMTSTIKPCLVLYDNNFLFNYLSNIPLPSKEFILREIKKIESKLEKSYKIYKTNKKTSEDLINSIYNDFLRLYIASQKQIPGSKHILVKQAKKLGLDCIKRNLWEQLEWMQQKIKKIKTSI